MKNKILSILTITFLVTSCAGGPPKDAFRLSETSMQDKQRQSRYFNTSDEIALLSSGIAVLQDLGYTIEETEKNAGLVTASKVADATNTGQQVSMFLLAVLANNPNAMDSCDDEQKIKVSFITKKSNNNQFIARISFQRIIWNKAGQVNLVETIKDDEIYQNFFHKLSKSVFLEAHKI
jgi:hypothetical protein